MLIKLQSLWTQHVSYMWRQNWNKNCRSHKELQRATGALWYFLNQAVSVASFGQTLVTFMCWFCCSLQIIAIICVIISFLEYYFSEYFSRNRNHIVFCATSIFDLSVWVKSVIHFVFFPDPGLFSWKAKSNSEGNQQSK